MVMLLCSYSVLVGSGLGNILSMWNLPALTLPFNVVTLLLFVCLMPPLPTTLSEVSPASGSPQLNGTDSLGSFNSTHPRNESRNEEIPDWAEVATGTFLSMGEVYGVDTLVGSCVIFLGILIFSPLHCLMSFVGAFLGTAFGM